MSEHKATPEQWEVVARLALSGSTWGSTIYELLFRLEALEAAQRPRVFTADEVAPIVTSAAPAGSLVERVAAAPDDRAAIREVAAWLRKGGDYDANAWASLLEQEADRSLSQEDFRA